jgi:hypothetical protein
VCSSDLKKRTSANTDSWGKLLVTVFVWGTHATLTTTASGLAARTLLSLLTISQ